MPYTQQEYAMECEKLDVQRAHTEALDRLTRTIEALRRTLEEMDPSRVDDEIPRA